jgi:hypothetical protein
VSSLTRQEAGCALSISIVEKKIKNLHAKRPSRKDTARKSLPAESSRKAQM